MRSASKPLKKKKNQKKIVLDMGKLLGFTGIGKTLHKAVGAQKNIERVQSKD